MPNSFTKNIDNNPRSAINFFCHVRVVQQCCSSWIADEGNPYIAAGSELTLRLQLLNDGSTREIWYYTDTLVRIANKPLATFVPCGGSADDIAPTATNNMPFDSIVPASLIPEWNFSEQMVIKGGSIFIYDGNIVHKIIDASDPAQVELSNDGRTIKLLQPGFTASQAIRILIPDNVFCDLDGNSFSGSNGNQTQFGISMATTTAPDIVDLRPVDGQTSWDLDVAAAFTFDNPMIKDVGAIRLLTHPGLVLVKEYTVEPDLRFLGNESEIVILDTSGLVQNNQSYTFEIEADALKGTNGLYFGGMTAGFIVFSTDDTIAPTIQTQAPAPASSGNALADPVITYSENILFIGAGELKIRDTGSGNVIKIYDKNSADALIVDDAITLTNSGMISGGNYSLEQTGETLSDESGNYTALIADGSYTFNFS